MHGLPSRADLPELSGTPEAFDKPHVCLVARWVQTDLSESRGGRVSDMRSEPFGGWFGGSREFRTMDGCSERRRGRRPCVIMRADVAS